MRHLGGMRHFRGMRRPQPVVALLSLRVFTAAALCRRRDVGSGRDAAAAGALTLLLVDLVSRVSLVSVSIVPTL